MSGNSAPRHPWFPPSTDATPSLPLYWTVMPSYRAAHAHEQVGIHDRRPPVINEDELDDARRQLRNDNLHASDTSTLLVPDGFPHPHVRLSSDLWSDLLHLGSYHLYSRRLRNAMALPDDAAQFCPIDLETESDALHAKDYRWLARLNMERNVIDPELSTSTWKIKTLRSTGEQLPVIGDFNMMVIRPSFRPRFDLFKPSEASFMHCATDALQARVMAAGCLGVSFEAFGVTKNVPWWLIDEDGKRVRDPNQPVTDVATPIRVLRERPDLIPGTAPQ